MAQRKAQCAAPDANFEGMDNTQLERSLTSHRGHLTKFMNSAEIKMYTLRTSPSRRAAQELESLKQAIDWKVEDIELGYNIWLIQGIAKQVPYLLPNFKNAHDRCQGTAWVHFREVITRNTPAGANIFREKG